MLQKGFRLLRSGVGAGANAGLAPGGGPKAKWGWATAPKSQAGRVARRDSERSRDAPARRSPAVGTRAPPTPPRPAARRRREREGSPPAARGGLGSPRPAPLRRPGQRAGSGARGNGRRRGAARARAPTRAPRFSARNPRSPAAREPRVMWAGVLAPLWGWTAALGMLCAPALQAFNLDVDKLTVYSGPEGSYFGYAVDFHLPAARAASVLVGAPRANTSQPNIVEGGAVYYCPWPAQGSARCRQIPFDVTKIWVASRGLERGNRPRVSCAQTPVTDTASADQASPLVAV